MLSEAETSILRHWSMWGYDGYPIHKAGNRWLWGEWFGVKGSPVAFRTKREAFQAVDRYVATLIDRKAGR